MPMNIDFDKLHRQAREHQLDAYVKVEASFVNLVSQARSAFRWAAFAVAYNIPYAIFVSAANGDDAWCWTNVAATTCCALMGAYAHHERLEASDELRDTREKIAQLRRDYGLSVVRGGK